MAYLDQRSIVIPLEKDHSFHINSAQKKNIRIKRKKKNSQIEITKKKLLLKRMKLHNTLISTAYFIKKIIFKKKIQIKAVLKK